MNTTSLALKRLPAPVQNGLYQYVKYGTMPGSFLKAVLENNLLRAIQYADDDSLLHLKTLVDYLHWEVPGLCHGSPEAVSAWVKQGGEAGRAG